MNLNFSPTDLRLTEKRRRKKSCRNLRKKERKREKRRKKQARKKNKKKQTRKKKGDRSKKEKQENTKKIEKRRKNAHSFYFVPAIVIFIVSLIILIYCKYRCIWESGREAAPPDQAVVPAFVVPAGVPEWVTTPRLLCMHYYFSSQFTLVQETAQCYFPGPQLAGSTETVELGIV